MRKRQLPLLVDQRGDTRAVWPAMTEAERRQVTRCYAKAIDKAARCRMAKVVGSEGAQDDDAGK